MQSDECVEFQAFSADIMILLMVKTTEAITVIKGWLHSAGSQPGSDDPHGRHEHRPGGAGSAEEAGPEAGDGEESLPSARPGRASVRKVSIIYVIEICVDVLLFKTALDLWSLVSNPDMMRCDV